MYAGAQSVTVPKAKIVHVCVGGRFPGRPREIAREADRAFSRTVKSESRSLKRNATMLYTIAVVLIILWLLGLVTSTTMGGFIHVLLVVAIVVVLLRVISGRKPL
jgi:uncharacterized membrane protein